MKSYTISDIHGCFFTLQELFNKIGLNKCDHLFLLGDYINRGPRSKEVVDYIIKLQKEGYKIEVLKGNHEDMVFDSIRLDNWTIGETETLKSFNITHLNQLENKYLNWFSKLKHHTINEDYIFVHAGLNFNNENPFDDKNSMLWINNWYDTINYEWLQNKVIIHGHKPIKKKVIIKMLSEINKFKVLNIDNGCHIQNQNGFGNLCCFELNQRELFFQKNID
ncbi:metallophosphoesterase family protein [Riemerella anatipestifer]|uniref:Metallophosphoesterase family protein n=1 Tax=Riemerella anatipestifer TaxID=34085 RepID=A0AAP6LLP4_RIEAN|nr:metallophosphoesterase family protein [Riemerella anatipestifer]MBT0549910.1 serine/threonine protein phosphatase [Riemerella anatipestifer]MBT0556629.1 serine/threonine protein phosphatase [Riemerella anatipestifer]MBT0560648.1 serine/threonine protein phosphatase [Riemerella anatipestifer]MCO7355796.1 serine/threonine protein phosphatase [Riemerella anatipestifer]MCU7541325.1 serine/threonine protein phosphatase [Riemerella anatipestifer]